MGQRRQVQMDRDVQALIEENQRLRAIVDRVVPAEVLVQLPLNLSILDDADAMHDGLPDAVKAKIEATPTARQYDQLVKALAYSPTEARNRIRRCVSWLLAEVSRPVDAAVSSPRRLQLIAGLATATAVLPAS